MGAFMFSSRVRAVIRYYSQLQSATRTVLRQRLGSVKKQRKIERYTPDEFRLIRNAARKVVQEAHARIHPAYLMALQHPDSTENPERARALRELLTTGSLQSTAAMLALNAFVVRSNYNRATLYNVITYALYPKPDEIYACAVMLACQRGLNLAPIEAAPMPTTHEPGIVQLDLDKPRRGPRSRFWPEIISDTDDAKSARLVTMIEEITEPARHRLALLGQPTDRLLIRALQGGKGFRTGLPPNPQRRRSKWVPRGLTVDFQRLRRSVPDEGVQKQASDHDPETYLHYVRTDSELVREHQAKAVEGLERAFVRAKEALNVRLLRDDQAPPPNQDSVLASCEDPDRHPATNAPCLDGYTDFLSCLACPNAATAPRHLPRQLAALQMLDSLRNTLSADTWERRFATRYIMLRAMVDTYYTDDERLQAADHVSPFLPLIRAALTHEVPQ
ncbi:hypothetical protein [Actinoplanes subtropicus]|uniref:hypothetical protein n=1 Tax=Actinoplanes subtropicus TaxID=543632 RepID=UPI0012F95689|nr:hypothetical protein [Actinoplanes subtropicus]